MSIKDKELKWLGIDFDNTLAHNTGYPTFEPTVPLDGAIEAMNELAKKWKITIYTSRHWADYQIIEDWLIRHNIPFRRIICGKPLFKYMIDDRNIEFKGKWKKTLKKVK